MFLIKNDNDLLQECGFLRFVDSHFRFECKTIFLEQNEDYLEYTKNQEESLNERIMNKQR